MFHLRIGLGLLPLATALAAMLANPVSAQMPAQNWYRGNTHTHTLNSDGDSAPDEVVRWYREHHYQFIFITDHEFITDPGPLNALFGAQERFLVLPGQEITQWGDDPARSAAHVNALFTRHVIQPVGERRCRSARSFTCGAHSPVSMPLAETFRANINAVREQNGIAQVNHPNYRWSVRPEDLNDIPDGTLIEIWNGLSGINNLGGDDGAGDVRPSSEGYWDTLLSAGKIIWAVGADDSHEIRQRGQAWIMVRASELTPAAIRASIESGDFYASNGVFLESVTASATDFTITIPESRGAGPRYRTRFIGQGGRTLATVAGNRAVYRFAGDETYVRAVVEDSDGRRAWTQPVFRDGRRRRA